jgi:hypothetical protein
LTTSQVSVLTTSQINSLPTSMVRVLSTAQFDALTSYQIGALSTGQVASISTNSFLAIGSADIPGLTNIAGASTASVMALSTGMLQSLSTDQIVALTTVQFFALTANQLASVTTGQVAVMESADVRAIGSVDMPYLANFGQLSTSAVAALTTSEVRALTSVQLGAMSSLQILALDKVGVTLSNTQTAALHVNNQSNFAAVSSQLTKLTPIALDLDGNGVRTLSVDAGAVFDVNADGKAESVGWLSSADAWLALDRNGNGLIDDGSELFGSGTSLPDGSKALDGFAALRVLDTNQDGVIDAQDSAFANLSVWVDANSNAKTDAGELRSLAQAGVQSLSLIAKPTAIIDQGNLIGLMGSYTTTDGRSHELADVWLTANPVGARVVDLSALDHGAANAGSLSRITFTGNGAGDTLKVALDDVLSFGDTSVVAGLDVGSTSGSAKQMVVSGEAQDTVQLADAGNWTMSGTTMIGDAAYRVLTQGMAQLLIEDKVKIVTV